MIKRITVEVEDHLGIKKTCYWPCRARSRTKSPITNPVDWFMHITGLEPEPEPDLPQPPRHINGEYDG